MEKKVINNYVSFWVEDNGILFCKISNLDPYQKFDYKIAQESLEIISELSKNISMPIIIDLRDVQGTFSIAAGHLLSKSLESVPLVSFEVYVVNSLAVNLLIQSYKRIYDTKIPHTIFKDMITAKNYCLQYKN